RESMIREWPVTEHYCQFSAIPVSSRIQCALGKHPANWTLKVGKFYNGYSGIARPHPMPDRCKFMPVGDNDGRRFTVDSDGVRRRRKKLSLDLERGHYHCAGHNDPCSR